MEPFLAADTTAFAELAEAVDSAVAAEAHRNTPLGPDEQVDPNHDDALELARLPGVGPALADRIVAARAHGVFSEPSHLLAVPGIGTSTLEQITPHLAWDDVPPGIPVPQGLSEAGGGGIVRINVNLADADDLARIPGVGPALAGRMIEHRSEHGPFRTAEELEAVSGIGPALLEGMRGWVVFEGPAVEGR